MATPLLLFLNAIDSCKDLRSRVVINHAKNIFLESTAIAKPEFPEARRT